MTKDETMTETSIQFWSGGRDNFGSYLTETKSSSGSSRSLGRTTRDLTHDDLDKFKSSLPCSRMFIYSRSPKPAIYMLFGKFDIHHYVLTLA
jgi:hypothetical protein